MIRFTTQTSLSTPLQPINILFNLEFSDGTLGVDFPFPSLDEVLVVQCQLSPTSEFDIPRKNPISMLRRLHPNLSGSRWARKNWVL
ncbi:uncharacterized protein METZ01_LOCUS235149 [marine metagenome]|uniref:Uncharacterized protein n=1 Tax=marine metagenome TaxID=408172 RepID=A0A382H583_9ZZZZ